MSLRPRKSAPVAEPLTETQNANRLALRARLSGAARELNEAVKLLADPDTTAKDPDGELTRETLHALQQLQERVNAAGLMLHANGCDGGRHQNPLLTLLGGGGGAAGNGGTGN